MWRRSLVSAFVSLALLAATALEGGCNTAPTLPLPPPVVHVGSPNTQGLVVVRGEALPLAYVSVFNERSELGAIARADQEGGFEIEIEAAIGDLITVWSEIDGELSERKHTTVPAPR